jgi:hypothetical protein
MERDVREHVEAMIILQYSEIIRLQKEALDELYSILSQYLAADELDRLPCVEKMSKAAELNEEIL